jgi:hypothetical protein
MEAFMEKHPFLTALLVAPILYVMLVLAMSL